MIFVRRDVGLIPPDLLRRAIEAQERLESLPPSQRVAFIKSKADVWRAFKDCLTEMSYGKCWYSEMPVDQTFHDVDHFRPKLRARRSLSEVDAGYEWLAFSWENFRLAAQRSNRPSTNEDTEETEGKGDWFPLLEGSPRATWDLRCEDDELPALLDPIRAADVELLVVEADGRIGPSRFCYGTNMQRVKVTIEVLGLNLPNLVAARKRIMNEVKEWVDVLLDTMEKAQKSELYADFARIDSMNAALRRKSSPTEPYAAAARSALRFAGLAELVVTPEHGSSLHPKVRSGRVP